MLECEVAGEDPEGLDLCTLGCFSAVLQGRDPLEHVLLSDGVRQIRLDVRGGTMCRGPVRLRFAFEGLCGIDARLLTLRRLLAFDRLGRMPRQLFLPEPRAGRWTAALRAADAHRAGASQREIAEALFGSDRVRRDWTGPSDHLRSNVRRLLHFGRRMTCGGWRDLLRAPPRG